MRAQVRDIVAVAALAIGILGACAAWTPLGPWTSLGCVFASGLIAAAAYRVRRPAIPLRGPLAEPFGRPAEQVSTRRPS